MAQHLTDKQKKKIIADYVELGSYNAVAKKHGVSLTTVKRVVLREPDTVGKVKQKKEENTADILAYMDSKTGSIKRFADYLFETRLNPGINQSELDGLSLPQLTTVFGVVIDKALKSKEIGYKKKGEDTAAQLSANMAALAEILKTPAKDRKISGESELSR